MYIYEHQFRVLYGHVDRMGVVYYGNYPMIYESARNEMLRALGLDYRKIEEDCGIMMPVRSMNIQYIASAYYDDLLTIKVMVKTMPTAKMIFYYEIYNAEGKLINEAETTLAFVKADTFIPCRPPRKMLDLLAPYF